MKTSRALRLVKERASDSFPTKRVKLEHIRDGKNARIFLGKLDELRASIASRGLLQPPLVRQRADDCYELIAGYRRMHCIRAIHAENPSRFAELDVSLFDGSDLEAALANLEENTGRHSLTIYELGQRCVELSEEHALSGSEIGERLGYGSSYVNNAIRVVKRLHPKLLRMLAEGAEHRDRYLFSRRHLFAWAAMDHEKQIRRFEELCPTRNKPPRRKPKKKEGPPPWTTQTRLLAALTKSADESSETALALEVAKYLMGLRKDPPIPLS